MATPKTKGVYVRPRRAWGLETQGGAGAIINAVAAQFSYAAIFNDSTPPIDLAVYGLSLFQTNAAIVVELRSLSGVLPGATKVSAANPVVSGGPTPAGSFWVLNSATVFGSIVLELGGSGQWFFQLDDTPLIIIPPNWSLVFKPQLVNVAMGASGLWGSV